MALTTVDLPWATWPMVPVGRVCGGGEVEGVRSGNQHWPSPCHACRGRTHTSHTQLHTSHTHTPPTHAPMLMVACREMTSGDSGVSVVTSSVARSCWLERWVEGEGWLSVPRGQVQGRREGRSGRARGGGGAHASADGRVCLFRPSAVHTESRYRRSPLSMNASHFNPPRSVAGGVDRGGQRRVREGWRPGRCNRARGAVCVSLFPRHPTPRSSAWSADTG